MLADVAVSAIRAMAIRPDAGPVGIVGLCVNGSLALEVARQLRQSGANIVFTAAIDSWAPGYFQTLPRRHQRLWIAERKMKRVAYFIRKLLSGRMRPMATATTSVAAMMVRRTPR